MTAQRYEKIGQWFRARPAALRILKLLNKLLPAVVYVLYPLTAALLLLGRDMRLVRFLVVPAVGFCAVTVVRRKINAPRPYEVLNICPLIPRNKSGESFPSRHLSAMFLITMAMGWLNPMNYLPLTVIGLAMMAVRVLAGIHFPKDVFAGAALGIFIGLIGLYWIP